MKLKFKSVIEIMDYFKTESKCAELLELQRWNGNVVCPHCAKDGIVSGNPYITNRGYKCSEKTCYRKFSVTVGTVMENSKIPLRKWFAGIYLATAHKKGISSYQLSRDIGITQKSAWFMLGRIREMMKDVNSSVLNGMVEADETYIGGKRANKHKHKREKIEGTGTVTQQPIMGMIQRQEFEIIQRPHKLNPNKTVEEKIISKQSIVVNMVISEAKGAIMKPLLKQAISPNAIFMTDGFGGYYDLQAFFKQHEIINHSQDEFVRGKFHTNSIEGYWSLLKRGIIGIYHQVSPKHLHRYCNEFTYRYNSRHITDQERFINSLSRLANGVLSYKELIKNV